MIESYDRRLFLCNVFWVVCTVWQIFTALTGMSSGDVAALSALFLVFRILFLLLSLSTYPLCFLAFREASIDVRTHGDDPVFRRAAKIFEILVPVTLMLGVLVTLSAVLRASLVRYLTANSGDANAAAFVDQLTNVVNLSSNLIGLGNLTGAFMLVSVIRQKLRKRVMEMQTAALIVTGLSVAVMLVYYLIGIASGRAASSNVFLMILSKLLMIASAALQAAAFRVRDRDVRARIVSMEKTLGNP